MITIPNGVNINNLIDDLKIFSWQSADILLNYSKKIKDFDSRNQIIKSIDENDPVTEADLKVNEYIIKNIEEKYFNVDWKILSEENVKKDANIEAIDSDWLWVLDPLDGTKDFIQGTGNYAMHLALNYKNKPVLGVVLIPVRDELWISDGSKVWCENRDGLKKKFNQRKKKNLSEMKLVTSKNHSNEILKDLINKVDFKDSIIMGSIGCKIASIIRGDSDIYISLSLQGKSSPKDWDFAAPEAILKAAGGVITNLDNKELEYNNRNYEQQGFIVASNSKENHKDICSELKNLVNVSDLRNLDI